MKEGLRKQVKMAEEPKQKNLEQKIDLAKAEEPEPEVTTLAKIVCTSLGAACFGACIAGYAFGLNYLLKKYQGKDLQEFLWIACAYTTLSVAAYCVIPDVAFYALEKIIDRYKTTNKNN